jgi:hypothetical protein
LKLISRLSSYNQSTSESEEIGADDFCLARNATRISNSFTLNFTAKSSGIKGSKPSTGGVIEKTFSNFAWRSYPGLFLNNNEP